MSTKLLPRTFKITPLQNTYLNTSLYAGKSSILVRFFLDKLINGELPKQMQEELRILLDPIIMRKDT